MALKDTVKKMERMLMDLAVDLKKASEKGNRAASQRVRTGTIKFAKLSKQYRKESVAADKKGSGTKLKKAKKTTRKKVAKKKAAKKKTATKTVGTRKQIDDLKAKAIGSLKQPEPLTEEEQKRFSEELEDFNQQPKSITG